MVEPNRVRCVAAIPCNPVGKILLQQRDDKPGLPFAGHWTTFGGQIEEGESPEVAMRRELLEEIELELPLKLWKIFEHVQRNGQVVVEQYVYVGNIDVEANEIQLNEGQALGYFGLEDMDRLPIAFGFETLFREFFALRDTLFT
jgi:8-oxo-dGTP diphosphatase